MPSSTSIYRQVVAAVVSQLSGISVDAGYNLTVDKVYDYDVSPAEDMAEDIVIGVNERSFQISANYLKLTPAYDCRNTVPVGIRAFARTNANAVNDVRRQLVDDIARALFTRVQPPGGGGGLFFLGIPGTPFESSLVFESLGSQPLGSGGLANLTATLTVAWLGDPTNPSLQ